MVTGLVIGFVIFAIILIIVFVIGLKKVEAKLSEKALAKFVHTPSETKSDGKTLRLRCIFLFFTYFSLIDLEQAPNIGKLFASYILHLRTNVGYNIFFSFLIVIPCKA